jgi:hypothetical protein
VYRRRDSIYWIKHVEKLKGIENEK